jgi:hypothetical protein
VRLTVIKKAIVALTGAIGLSMLISTGALAVGVGKTCGGMAGIKCDDGLWCEQRAGRCGVTDVQGKCVKVPTVCPMADSKGKGKSKGKISLPVCGCDKKTYGNDCERRVAKVQKDHNGRCQ